MLLLGGKKHEVSVAELRSALLKVFLKDAVLGDDGRHYTVLEFDSG